MRLGRNIILLLSLFFLFSTSLLAARPFIIATGILKLIQKNNIPMLVGASSYHELITIFVF